MKVPSKIELFVKIVTMFAKSCISNGVVITVFEASKVVLKRLGPGFFCHIRTANGKVLENSLGRTLLKWNIFILPTS